MHPDTAHRQGGPARDNDIDLASIPGRALRVLTRPTAFFRDRPRTGRFPGPLVSVAVVGIANVLMVAVRVHACIGGGAARTAAVDGLGAVTLVTVIGSFIPAGFLIRCGW